MCPFNNYYCHCSKFPTFAANAAGQPRGSSNGEACKGVAPVGVADLSVKHDRLAVDSLHTNTMGNLQQVCLLAKLVKI
jgi:hypothetical protein